MRIKLRFRDNRPPEEVELEGAEVIVGRGVRSDVIVRCEAVSKRHAFLTTRDGRCVIRDERSHYGTMVNGARLEPGQSVSIGPQDEIELGNNCLLRVIPSAKERAAAAGLDEEERGFLQHIHDHPGAPGPRLVYADWLLERGDPRGEHIALQGAAGANRGNSSRDHGIERVKALLDEHGATWLAPLFGSYDYRYAVAPGHIRVGLPGQDESQIVMRPRLEGGFLAHPICLSAEGLRYAGDTIFRVSPTVYEAIGEGIRNEARSTMRLTARVRGPRSAGDRVELVGYEYAAGLEQIYRGRRIADREMAARALYNQRALADLAVHDNVARARGLALWGRHGDIAVVMEWLDGRSLGAVLRKLHGAEPETASLGSSAERNQRYAVAVGIVRQICLGLHHLHSACDRYGRPAEIKPRIEPCFALVTRAGRVALSGLEWATARADAVPFPEALGFFASKLRRPEGHGGLAMGPSRCYVPPEVMRGQPATRRSAIYQCGVILYEMCCSRSPFQGLRRPLAEVEGMIVEGRFPRPSAMVPGFPEPLERVILRAMALSPGDRHGEARDLVHELDRVSAEGSWPTEREWLAAQLAPYAHRD